MISSEYQEKIKCSDQGATIAYMLGMMNDNVKKVNIFNNLVAHNDEYIYFRTDHHWTALGAYYAYETLCAAAGMEAASLEDFELLNEGQFKGTFYYECMQSWRLRLDELIAYIPPGNLEMMITTAIKAVAESSTASFSTAVSLVYSHSSEKNLRPSVNSFL